MANSLVLLVFFISMMVFIVAGQTCRNNDDISSEAQDQEGDVVSFLQSSGAKLDTGMLEIPLTASKPFAGSGTSLVGKTSVTSKLAPMAEQTTSNSIAASSFSLYQLSKVVLMRLREVPSIFWILPVVAVIITIMCFYVLAVFSMKDGHSGQEPLLSTSHVAAHSGSIRKAAVSKSYYSSPSVPQRGSYGHQGEMQSVSGTSPARHSLGASSPLRQLVGASTPTIPKITPNLVMNSMESRFAVNLASLARLSVGSTLDIIAPTRSSLLSLIVKADDTLDICLTGHAAMPRCSVTCQPSAPTCEIRGERGTPYGHFTRTQRVGRSGNETTIDVFYQGHAVMRVIEYGKFNYAITDPQGRSYGLARKNTTDYAPDVDYFEIRAQPGTDTVLLLAVVLADLVFFSVHE